MPLSFRTENHGNIAFGFFNIESDMLLLENHFFFASDFCEWIIEMTRQDDTGQKKFQHQVYYIADPHDIGDLMGAIHGVRFTGFIGSLYQVFPFPDNPSAFKQNPEGYQTRETVLSLIEDVSIKTKLVFEFLKDNKIAIGPYLFDKAMFHELILYVCAGGYPRWKEEIMPQYVIDMRQSIEKSSVTIFQGVF